MPRPGVGAQVRTAPAESSSASHQAPELGSFRTIAFRPRSESRLQTVRPKLEVGSVKLEDSKDSTPDLLPLPLPTSHLKLFRKLGSFRTLRPRPRSESRLQAAGPKLEV